ncbi:hypothetical protein IAU59_001663 [Kwoniella sp. CBS 9459]
MPRSPSKASSSPPNPHPDRPFSPSPARENWHSTSRPPSLLFGAPPVGTIATSFSFDFSGLPSPSVTSGSELPSGLTRHSKTPSNDQSFSDVPYEPSPRRRHESEPAFGTPDAHGDGIVAGQFVRREHQHSSLRQRSDSISTTSSSSSPPLGATSLLSAIAGPVTPQNRSEKKKYRYKDGGPGSPASFDSQNEISHDSSTGLGLPASRSFPRLHQPTVVRRTSGRGLAFIPPPAQTHISPTNSSFAVGYHGAPVEDDQPDHGRPLQAAGRLAQISRQLVPQSASPAEDDEVDTSSSFLPAPGDEPLPPTPEEETSIRIYPDPQTLESPSANVGSLPLAHPSPLSHSSSYQQLINESAESEALNPMYHQSKENLALFDPPEQEHFAFDSIADPFGDAPNDEVGFESRNATKGTNTPSPDAADHNGHAQYQPPAQEDELAGDNRHSVMPFSVGGAFVTSESSPWSSPPATDDVQVDSELGASDEQHPFGKDIPVETYSPTPSPQDEEDHPLVGEDEDQRLERTNLPISEAEFSETIPEAVQSTTEQIILPQEIHDGAQHRPADQDDVPSTGIYREGDERASSTDSATVSSAQSSTNENGEQTAQIGKHPAPSLDETETLHEVDALDVQSSQVLDQEAEEVPDLDQSPLFKHGNTASAKPQTRTHTRGPSNESELMLNEVSNEMGIEEPESETGQLSIPASLQQPPSSTSLGAHAGESTQVARYKARAGSRVRNSVPTANDTASTSSCEVNDADQPQAQAQARSISLYAGLTRASKPLPQLMSYRLELYLVWPEAAQQKLFTWIPGRKYVPDWDLKIIGGGRADRPFVLDVRDVARAVVGRIPVFGRLAVYM